jgi:hypothetical protein
MATVDFGTQGFSNSISLVRSVTRNNHYVHQSGGPKTVMIPINQDAGQGTEDSKDSIDKVVASHHAKVIVFYRT